MMRIIVFGPQLSGKGTQAKNIAAHYGLTHLTTGGILREMNERGDAAMKKKLEPVFQGKLFPDDEMNAVVARYLDGVTGGFILDGYPRTIPQADFLAGYCAKREIKIDAALLIDITDDEVMKRLEFRIKEEGRKDDMDRDALSTRLAAYQEKTVPVIDRYRKEGKLIEINGVQTREQVFDEIKRKITAYFGPKC